MKALGRLLGAIPFVFALLRAISTGSDLRYLWVALAAASVAAAVMAYRSRGGGPSMGRIAVALIASMAAAGSAGFALGAQSAPAVLFVALGFAICEVGGLALACRAHPRRSEPGDAD